MSSNLGQEVLSFIFLSRIKTKEDQKDFIMVPRWTKGADDYTILYS